MYRGILVSLYLVASPVFAAETASAGPAPSPLLDFADKVYRELDADADPTRSNYIGLIDDGYDALLIRVHLIRAARRSMDIQTFILENDECGRLIMYELIQAAKRGVRVRLLTDHFMSARDPEWIAFLATAHPNLEIKYYRPPADRVDPSKLRHLLNGILFLRASNQRMHNKVFMADRSVVLIGGRNIDNHYYNHSTSYTFLDRDAVIIGPVLPAVADSFEKYWAYRRAVPGEQLKDVERLLRRDRIERPKTREEFRFNGFFDALDREVEDAALVRARFVDTLMPAAKVTFLVDSPGRQGGFLFWGGGPVRDTLRKVMGETEDTLVIQSPYLILNWKGRRIFKRLRRDRPDTQVLISTNSFAATDNTLAYSANYKLRSSYIERLGFHIYEYKPHPADLLARLPNYPDLVRRAKEKIEKGEAKRLPFLSIHAKSFVRDDRIAYVGSYNIDPRSENLNSEIGVLIEDVRIAKALKEMILSTTGPDSSWVIARKKLPLAEVNLLIEGISGLTPIDIWPLRNTSSFELLPGKEPLDPDHEDFYEHYKDAGGFPGAEGISMKQIVTQLYKVVGTLTIPAL